MTIFFEFVKILLYLLQDSPKNHQAAIEGIEAENTNAG